MHNQQEAIDSLIEEGEEDTNQLATTIYIANDKKYQTSEEIDEWEKTSMNINAMKRSSLHQFKSNFPKIQHNFSIVTQSKQLIFIGTRYDNSNFRINNIQKRTNVSNQHFESPKKQKFKKQGLQNSIVNISNFSFDRANKIRIQDISLMQRNDKFQLERLRYQTFMKRIRPKIQIKATDSYVQHTKKHIRLAPRSLRNKKQKFSPIKKRELIF